MVYFFTGFFSLITNLLKAGKYTFWLLMFSTIFFCFNVEAQNPDSLAAMEIIPDYLLDRSTPEDYTEINGSAAFTVHTFDGPVLWISDGTLYGSTKITFESWEEISLHDGPLSREVGHANGLLYFLAEVNNEWNIWATDGTKEGTFEVVNAQTTGYSNFYNMTSFGDRVAFTAYSSNNTPRLYLVNENNSGAEIVQSIQEIESSHKMVELDSSLYVVESIDEDRILNKIDPNGSISQAWQMPNEGNAEEAIENLTVAENRLFFVGNDGTGEALWVFNGATATRLFDPHEDAEEFQEALNPTAVDNKVYFFSHPWNSSSNDFSNNAYLYVSDGTESGTYQLWSNGLDENGYLGIEASNLPMAAAGSRLLFTAPDDPDDGTLWWTVGTTSESFQTVMVNGESVGSSFSDPDPISVDNGAWFTNSNDLFFTSGTNDSAYAVPPEEVNSYDHLAAVNGRPWFSGRTSYSDELAVWRVRPQVEIPDTLSLIAPEDDQEAVSTLPTFEWTESEHAEKYRIQITTSFRFSEIDIDTAEIIGNTFTLDDSLTHENFYYWRVQGINDGITGAWSEEFSFETRAPLTVELPDTVQLISPDNGSTLAADKQPILSWTTSKSASEYNLQLSSEQTFGSTQIDTTLSVSESGDAFSDTSFTVQNEFTNDTNYYWRVKALNEAGESAWSQTYSFFVLTPDTIDVPDAPKLVYPENEETIRVGQTPELTWISSDGATEYKLHFAQNENFEQLLVDTTLTASGDATERSDTTYVIEDDLIGSETYFWRVRATNKAGESSWSETFSFLVVSGVSAEEEGSIPESFELQQNYPNPFNPTTVIPYQLPKATHVTIRVFDMLGRKMSVLVDDEKPAGRHTIILDASYYSSGMYIYQMNADNKIFTKKLMLIK